LTGKPLRATIPGTIRKSNLVVNIFSKTNTLHSFYGKAKYAFLAVFAITVMFSTFVSHRVYGNSVVGTVETKIVLTMDGKTQSIITTQNTIEGSLIQNGISMAGNDITIPPLNTYLTGKSIEVQVVRATPVLISDNGQSWSASSAYTEPYDILKQLNVEIFPEDRVTAELIMDPALEGAIGQKVIIERAPVFTIYVDDTTLTVRSWATNVADLLTEKGISLGANDIVEPGKTSTLSGVSEITVTRINYADVTENINIPFETVYKIDASLGLTGKRVESEGSAGSKINTYHIVYKNGVEASRTLTSSVINNYAESRVVYRGALVGVASHVSDGTYNRLMVTAFKEAPRGTKLMVTNLNNGKQILVTVVDSGPYVPGRILDLSPDAFRALGGTTGLLSNIAAQIVD
jgi:uncharacterized protein YabE (DUF348 family)